ncbi:hypothetical protein E6C60_2584 [Paenibacillus algicola]|uniref:Uncharacterized protein n=1 Tax=Paenibacillus algicola TaxID=2565926 RepID=A0A4P8XKQ7_9BACL|nr:hypothetical protein [Paenibacillus algicola]QCT03296.1 hypothetical protein E6C60_2584 [Paenibacillus algicola]
MPDKTKHYHVTNAFVDAVTGETVQVGTIFEADEERAERLKAADVIGKEATKAEMDAAKKEADQAPDGGKDAGDSQ